MRKSDHNNSITIAKALGIILMVIGHSGCPQTLFKFIYLFHYWDNKYCCLLCCISLLFFFYYFKARISMGCGYNKVVSFTFSAFSGILLTIYFSRQIESKMPFLKRSLYYIGNHTLEILALHFLVFRFVSYLFTIIYGIDIVHVAEHPVIKDIVSPHCYWWIIYSIAGIAIPLLFNKVWQITINKIIWIKL